MHIPFWFGLIHIGRPSGIGSYRYDVSATLCLWHRGSVPPSEPVWHRIWRVSWNWLPDRVYQHVSVERPDKVLLGVTKQLLAGKDPKSLKDDYLFAKKYWNSIDSSRWTGRERRLVGFGFWQREYWSHRSSNRSKMYIYLTGSKERSNPTHTVYVAPGALGKREDCPNDWYEPGPLGNEVAKQMSVVFHHGRASVEKSIGDLMIAHGMAQKTNIVKQTGAVLGNLAGVIAGR